MNDSTNSEFLLVGLSGSGKTNFLVALDVALSASGDDERLVHSDLASDRSYLQPLREKWLRGEELLRTSRKDVPPPHHLMVQHASSGTSAAFYLPDLAGESFDQYFETRSFSPDFLARLRKAEGVFLFVHCSQSADHEILTHPSLIDSVAMDEVGTGGSPPASSAGKDWELSDSARQSKLVDLLQFVNEARAGLRALKVAVIVSAWDRIESGPNLPEIPRQPGPFVRACWPLLDQYLVSHPDRFDFHVFGVSARGGGSSPEDIARITGLDNPCERIIVVDGAHRSNDLTRPVRWLLGLLPSVANQDV